MQHPKFASIIDSMQRGESHLALKTIESLINKKKAKTKMTEQEYKIILILKALCLTKVYDFGEADFLFSDYLKTEGANLISDKNILRWSDFLSAALNDYQNLKKSLCESMGKNTAASEEMLIEIMNICLKSYDFGEVSSYSLRLYKYTNNSKYLFLYIMAQFFLISGLDQHELSEDKIKKLDLASMFSDKLLKELNLSKEHEKQLSPLGKQLIKLILKISFQQKKIDRFREFLINYPHAYEIYDLERIQNSYLLFNKTRKSEDKLFLVKLNYERFRKDLDIDNFIAQFKIYKDYIDFLLDGEKEINDYDGEIANLPIFGDIDSTLVDNDSYLIKHFDKNMEELYLKSVQSKNHKNYRYLYQLILTTRIVILLKMNKKIKISSFKERFLSLIKEYIEGFSNSLTFTEEILFFLKELTEKELISESLDAIRIKYQNETDLTNKMIQDLSLLKLTFFYDKTNFGTKEEIDAFAKVFFDSYIKAVSINNKNVEKGERNIFDDYAVLYVDIYLQFVLRNETPNPNNYSIWINCLAFLEFALHKSPFNFDIKLRLIKIYDFLGCPEKKLELVKDLDIKSVQHDTLGVLYAKTIIEYGGSEASYSFVNGAMAYYAECFRESKESMLSSIKNNNHEKIIEFSQFDHWIDDSYFKSVCYLFKLENYLANYKNDFAHNENINYVLSFLNKKIKKDFTFNVDFKTLQTTLEKENNFFFLEWNFLGLYNNLNYFKCNVYRNEIEIFIRRLNFEAPEQIIIPPSLFETLNQFNSTIEKLNINDLHSYKDFISKKDLSSLSNHVDKLSLGILNEFQSFEVTNLLLEKSLYELTIKIIDLKPEREDFDEFILTQTNISVLIANIFDEFMKELKELHAFPKNVRIKSIRFYKKTLYSIIRFIKLAENLQPLLNKIAKKKSEDSKKKLQIFVKKYQSICKDLFDYSNKILQAISDYFSKMSEFCDGTMQKLIKEMIEKDVVLENDFYGCIERAKHTKQMVINTITNDYNLLANSIVNEIKEEMKNLKSIKI